MTSGLSLHRVDDATPAVEALAARGEGRVPFADLLADLPRRLRRTPAPGRAVHEAWWFDGADQVDLRWWPQGVSTSADAGPDHPLSGRRLALMTSYAKKLPWHRDEHGSRLSVLDLETDRYRHVLLVRAQRDGSVRPLRVHAGGLVWHGDRLYVAATGAGLYVCLLDDLVRVSSPGEAFGYRYVLPFRFLWRARAADGVEGFRYSFVSLDHDADRPTLTAGEHSDDLTRTRRIAQVDVSEAARADRLDLEVLDEDGPLRQQGAVSARGRMHRTVSQGRLVPGSVYAGPPGRLLHHRFATPMGNEDVSYSPAEDLLYGVSEHPTARWLYTMRRGWFD